MQRITALGLLALVGLVVVTAAFAATPKPKRWQWTGTKVEGRLVASTPVAPGMETGSDVLRPRCVGQGRGVAGRYSKFLCDAAIGSTNGSYKTQMTIRIRPIGSGKLCVVTTPEFKAVPGYNGTPWPAINPERACPIA